MFGRILKALGAARTRKTETCACCGFNTLEDKGYYEICEICFWEDDHVQEADPWLDCGANAVSLFEAQQNYKKYGAMEKRFIDEVRAIEPSDEKNPEWRPLNEADKARATTPREIETNFNSGKSDSYNYWER